MIPIQASSSFTNIRHQPIVRGHGAAIAVKVETATPGSYDFIEMPLPPRSGSRAGRR